MRNIGRVEMHDAEDGLFDNVEIRIHSRRGNEGYEDGMESGKMQIRRRYETKG